MKGGIILIDKPKGLTSFDCDKIVRRSSGIKKVGHSGTLDPFATGLLPVFVGDALKFMRYTDGYDKTYVCKALFGATSDTGDSEGEIRPGWNSGCSACEDGSEDGSAPKGVPTDTDFGRIRAALEEVASRKFQTPPKYSAKKINGKKAYDLARQGVEFELQPVPVEIYSLDILDMTCVEEGVVVEFKVHCSKGTYIRTICTDAGEVSGFGAYAMELRRVKVGPFDVEGAFDPADTGKFKFIDPIVTLNDMPEVVLNGRNAEAIRNGKKVPAKFVEGLGSEANAPIEPEIARAEHTLYKATYEGRLIAVIYVDEGIVRIDRGFA